MAVKFKKLEISGDKEHHFERAGHSAVIAAGKVYVTAGYTHDSKGELMDIKDMQILDMATGSVETKRLPTTFTGCRFHTGELVGSVIYFIGGFSTNSQNERVLMPVCPTYDTQRKTWSTLKIKSYSHFERSRDTATIFERLHHCSAVSPVNQHHIYIYGGVMRKQSLGDLILLDVKQGQVKLVVPRVDTLAPQPRQKASLTAVGSSLYLYGGTTQDPVPVSLGDSLCIYDCMDGEWVYAGSGGSTKPPRICHSTVGVGEQLVVAGGWQGQRAPYTLAMLDIALGRSASEPELTWSHEPAPKEACMDRMCPIVVVKGKTLIIIGGAFKDAGDHVYPGIWTCELRATAAAPKRAVASPAKAPKSAPLPQKAAGAGKRKRAEAKPQGRSVQSKAARKASPEEQEEHSETAKATMWMGRKQAKTHEGKAAPKSLRSLGNLSDSNADSDAEPPSRHPARRGSRDFPPAKDPEEGDRGRAKLEARLTEKEGIILELRNELEKERAQRKRAEEGKEDTKVRLDRMTERLREEQEDKGRLIEAKDRKNKELANSNAELEKDRAALRNTINSLQIDKTAQRLREEKLSSDLEKALTNVDAKQEVIERMTREKDASQQTLEATLRRGVEEVADLKRQLREWQQKAELYAKRIQELEEKLEQERQISKAAKDKATQLEIKLGEAAEQLSTANEQAKVKAQEHKQKLAAAEKKIALAMEQIEKLKAEKEDVSQQKRAADGKRVDLEKRLQERVQDMEAMQAELQRYKDRDLKELKDMEDRCTAKRKAISSHS